jgi:hypothetical protein
MAISGKGLTTLAAGAVLIGGGALLHEGNVLGFQPPYEAEQFQSPVVFHHNTAQPAVTETTQPLPPVTDLQVATDALVKFQGLHQDPLCSPDPAPNTPPDACVDIKGATAVQTLSGKPIWKVSLTASPKDPRFIDYAGTFNNHLNPDGTKGYTPEECQRFMGGLKALTAATVIEAAVFPVGQMVDIRLVAEAGTTSVCDDPTS